MMTSYIDSMVLILSKNRGILFFNIAPLLSSGSQNSHVAVFGSILLVFGESGVLRTLNGACLFMLRISK